jgi:predicted kinase
MNNNVLYVLVGISGTGKSTFVDRFLKTHPDITVYSSDKLRAVLGKDESDQSVSGQVFSTIFYNLDRDLKSNKNVMVDATSLTVKDRKKYIDIAKKHNAKIIAYVLERDKQTILANQKARSFSGGRFVPSDVIEKMFLKYKRPITDEGFDEVILV